MALRVLLPLLLALPTLALARGVVRVPSEAAVEGSVITLGEIATLDGLAPEQQAQVSAFTLGPAAAPSRHRVFSGQALRKQLAALGPDLVLDIPDQVRVHTAYREIHPEYLRERLKQALRIRMHWPESAVRFSNWRLPERFAVPMRAQRLVVHFRPAEDFLGRVTAQLELLDASDPKAPRVRRAASVEVDVRAPVVVTTRRLRRGESLGSDAIRLEEREFRLLSRDVITDLPQALGGRLKRSIGEGTPLLFRHLESEPLVRRGDIVVVHAGGPGLDVRVEGRALEHGAHGQVIRVENPISRRKFQAEVTGAGTACLRLSTVGSGP